MPGFESRCSGYKVSVLHAVLSILTHFNLFYVFWGLGVGDTQWFSEITPESHIRLLLVGPFGMPGTEAELEVVYKAIALPAVCTILSLDFNLLCKEGFFFNSSFFSFCKKMQIKVIY